MDCEMDVHGEGSWNVYLINESMYPTVFGNMVVMLFLYITGYET